MRWGHCFRSMLMAVIMVSPFSWSVRVNLFTVGLMYHHRQRGRASIVYLVLTLLTRSFRWNIQYTELNRFGRRTRNYDFICCVVFQKSGQRRSPLPSIEARMARRRTSLTWIWSSSRHFHTRKKNWSTLHSRLLWSISVVALSDDVLNPHLCIGPSRRRRRRRRAKGAK